MGRTLGLGIVGIGLLLAATPAGANAVHRCGGGKSSETATWLSVAHPGLGEWYIQDWGGFFAHAPQKKFWLGFIPVFGWPGYLQIKSAIDANHCRTNDDIAFRE